MVPTGVLTAKASGAASQSLLEMGRGPKNSLFEDQIKRICIEHTHRQTDRHTLALHSLQRRRVRRIDEK